MHFCQYRAPRRPHAHATHCRLEKPLNTNQNLVFLLTYKPHLYDQCIRGAQVPRNPNSTLIEPELP